MNHRIPLFVALVAASLAAAGPALAAGPAMRMALVRDGSVCASVDGSPLRCFATGSSKPRLPVWSRDGNRIAFIDDGAPANALASLVVIDVHGQVQSRTALKPVASGEVRSGMRFVESLQWLSADRVVVSGSINPSSTEHLVVDLLRGGVVAEHVDDAGGASFSPDGQHVLTIDGAPHFSAPASRAPVLRLDGQELLKGLPADTAAMGRARWAADGNAFALAAQPASGPWRLVLGQVATGGARWVDLPFDWGAGSKAPTLFWSGTELHLQRLVPAPRTGAAAATAAAPGARAQSVEDWVWSGPLQAGAWKRAAVPALDPARAAAALRAAALAVSPVPGALDADLWCTGCALDRVARRSGADPD